MRVARWLVENIAILLVYVFVLSVIQACVVLVTSTDGSIAPGWSGNPVGQVLAWALSAAWITTFYSPLLAVVLVLYRLLARFVGHPQAVGFAVAIALTLIVALTSAPDAGTVVYLGFASLGYAAALLRPSRTLGDLSPLVRGGLTGFALSFVWFVGSLSAIVWAADRASKRAWSEAGAIATAGTVLPAMMLFADLFRPDVPAENYLIAAVLVGGMCSGILALIYSTRRRGVRV